MKKEIKLTKRWLSAREAREFMDCSNDFLQKLRDEAQVSFTKIRGKFYYDIQSIERLFQKNKVV